MEHHNNTHHHSSNTVGAGRSRRRACVLASAAVFTLGATARLLSSMPLPRALELGATVTVVLGVHELGHLFALRRFGIRQRAVAFIPLAGAVIVCPDLERRDAATQAWVAIAGPIAGCCVSNALIGVFAVTGHRPCLDAAVIGLTLNGFNLIPVPPLDGGRAVGAVTRWLWLPGTVLLAAATLWLRSAVVVPVFAVCLVSTVARLRDRSTAYYRTQTRTRAALLTAYALAVCAVVGGLVVCARS
jgi:Zn-dependent protease